MDAHIVDLIVLGIIVLSFFTGLSQGFYKTILGPISLGIAYLFAISYYQLFGNLVISLVVGLLAPFVIRLIFSLLGKLLTSAYTDHPRPGPTSRFLGGIISIVWSCGIVGLSMVLMTMIPLQTKFFDNIKDRIVSSFSYSVIQQALGKHLTEAGMNMDSITSVLTDPEKRKSLEESPEFQKIMDEPALKAFFRDPEILTLVRDKKFDQLISHPKMKAILEDKNAMNQLMKLNKLIRRFDASSTKKSPDPSVPKPKAVADSLTDTKF